MTIHLVPRLLGPEPRRELLEMRWQLRGRSGRTLSCGVFYRTDLGRHRVSGVHRSLAASGVSVEQATSPRMDQYRAVPESGGIVGLRPRAALVQRNQCRHLGVWSVQLGCRGNSYLAAGCQPVPDSTGARLSANYLPRPMPTTCSASRLAMVRNPRLTDRRGPAKLELVPWD